MEKKKYSKPVVVAERFEPQEYCANCWYVESEDMYTRLYEDRGRRNEEYDNGEEIQLPTATRIPSNGSFKNVPEPRPMSGYYYESYTTEYFLIFIPIAHPYGPRANPVYSYTYEGKTYFFRNIQRNNNAS